MAMSFRFLSVKIPCCLHNQPNLPISKTLISPPPLIPPKLFILRSISIERLPTKPHSLSPSSQSPSNTLQPIEELPPKLQEIVKLFQAVHEPKAKYEQLLFYAKQLAPFDTQFKIAENKVQGCVSQVWVRAFLDDEDKNVRYEADSDSALTKGLAALLVQGFSGRPVEEILRASPDFVGYLGLQRSLTPSRNNGFLNMLKLMQKKAFQLNLEAEKGSDFVGEPSSSEDQNSVLNSNFKPKIEIGAGNLKTRATPVLGSEDSGSNLVLGIRGERIKERLVRELSPTELLVEDISYQHAGHVSVKGSEGETHFHVKVVSKEFEKKSLVKRHRLIYGLLQEELESGLHALSIVAKAPSEVSDQ